VGAAAVIVISAGLGYGPGSIADDVRQRAHQLGLRLVGPNCLGVISPAANLNASFSAHMPLAGDLALISQSGAIVAGLVEWSLSQGVGFSAITSMGDQLDVDFGDLLDYHAMDRSTRAILLYMESIKDPRKFISAARAAARAKPVIVVKAGRHERGAEAGPHPHRRAGGCG
jgi:acetyltransferase